MSYPNQKQITIHKAPTDAQNIFGMFNIYTLRAAMRALKNSSFKLWVYLASNQNNYTFYLSAADCADWGIKSDSFHSAVNDLINKQYLVNQSGHQYDFYEFPIMLSEKGR